MAADLLTLTEYAHATGREVADLETSDVDRAQWAITVASDAVRQYCDRDLTLNADAVQDTRNYRLYNRSLLEIDDCTSVSSVQLATTAWQPVNRTLDVSEWLSGPYNATIQTYIELQTNLPFPISPEMGFQWNADRYGFRPRPIILSVTAAWGWPSIPAPVKQAVVWVVGEIEASYLPYNQEAIENYSRTVEPRSSMAAAPGATPGLPAVSVRAASLLDPYTRVNV